jgi:hypothetical protein
LPNEPCAGPVVSHADSSGRVASHRSRSCLIDCDTCTNAGRTSHELAPARCLLIGQRWASSLEPRSPFDPRRAIVRRRQRRVASPIFQGRSLARWLTVIATIEGRLPWTARQSVPRRHVPRPWPASPQVIGDRPTSIGAAIAKVHSLRRPLPMADRRGTAKTLAAVSCPAGPRP